MCIEHPQASPEIAARRVQDQTILYHRDRGQVHALNESAGLVWDLCDGRHTVREIARALLERSGTEDAGEARARAEADVRALLDELGALGLLAAPAGVRG